MTIRHFQPSPRRTRNLAVLPAICCLVLALALASCTTGKGGSTKKGAVPSNPNEKRMAYGTAINISPAWSVVRILGPDAATKEALDTRRQTEGVLLMEAVGPATQQGPGSVLGIFLVKTEGVFIPKDYAERLQPHEFQQLAQDILSAEKAEAKKRKIKSGLLDMQISRETVNGKTALVHRLLGAGADGKTMRFINWEIYLDNGAGIAVKAICDPNQPGAEEELLSIVRSLRVQ